MASGAKNMFENFKKGVAAAGDRPCLGHRPMTNGVAGPYVWQTYKEVLQRILNLGSALAGRGLKKGSIVGVFSINRPEWLIIEGVCNAFGYVLVPLYDTLGPEAMQFIVTETEMSLVFASNDKFDALIKDKARYLSVQSIVLLDGVTDVEVEKGKGVNVDVVAFGKLEEEGKARPVEPPTDIADSDVVTIMYTSGTTGMPKGAMLTHKNFLANAAAIEFTGFKGRCFHLTPADVHISYLPLAHVFERMVVTYIIGVGASVGFYQGNTQNLLDDIAILKPTLFPSVPRLLNRVYDKVLAAVDIKGGLSSSLFHMGVESKRMNLQRGKIDHWLWDKLVFSKIKARLGGHVQCIITASAPISPEVLDFLRLAFCCEVHEAYGQTETTGGASITLKGDYESGHVGVPLPANEIKLVDVPEMNYTSKDTPYQRGEICYRGPNVFKGYFKNEEKTAEALDKDGWLHSGDIGLWDEKGRLKIIDRKKNIFKLAQGEYIAPEKIENVYCKSKYVSQIYVYGDSLKAFLVGVVVPDDEYLAAWCKQNDVAGTIAEYKNNPKVKELIIKDMLKVGKELGLKSFEQVKDIHIDDVPFSIENNLLTPTFKLKRPQAKEHYQAQIDQLIEVVQKAETEKEKKQHQEEEKKGKEGK